ncbi:TPA: zinc metalloprotease HtpX [Legionella pneumophila subsp. pneumophila]|uniref:Protease HtpX n=1 Tax=Legionella pneumophila (strain Lens) TaxID=297245 RepID=HTPX_LEGPL|nr:zinc metalloprotease HtpX [Legionella pneumophila]Q5WZY7.1 RecName: Full=Protease HtpX; AltName: Full=Heat shock protein HtpX [Legionella pneumophila str. Lens]AOW53071.1 protease HtpX [Legionella pneumophila subsp. pneumophila]AOW56029.1 protease HtpX [Legionella pneumophila subsp. pneumophila]AOW58378.1 protease HtpX [Legionella pneumophila subsp. pneumophila]AOW61440.1 protease HtpX [Legionella pneumophila subsp. pneumophila]AOW63871.1 protease HtpX [Legionella pneumophila subsp. pneumo
MINNLKTFILLASLTALLVVIGGLLGGSTGMLVALLFAGIMNFSAYWYSDTLVLKMYNAEPLSNNHFVYHIVSELAHRAGTSVPKVYLINNSTPNAFATGRNPENASIAVTTGLLDRLTQEEITGVLAHELAHVIHRDTLINVVSATIAGAISGIANMFMWLSMFGHNSNNQEGVHPVVGMIMMIVAPLAAGLIQMAISRSREFEADAGGAQISGNPQWLASALLKLDQANHEQYFDEAETHPATAHLFIINPLNGEKLANLFSTHPSTAERVARLRAMY